MRDVLKPSPKTLIEFSISVYPLLLHRRLHAPGDGLSIIEHVDRDSCLSYVEQHRVAGLSHELAFGEQELFEFLRQFVSPQIVVL